MSERAETMAELVFAAIRDRTTGYPFTHWTTRAELAAAATGAARAELLAATIAAGSEDIVACFAAIAPLLEPATVRAWALAKLREVTTAVDIGLLLGTLPQADRDELLPPLLQQRLEIANPVQRYEQVWPLLTHLPDRKRLRQRFDDEVYRRYGVELDYDRPEAEQPPEHTAAIIAVEEKQWGAAFTAWRTSRRAVCIEPSRERAALLDRAIDEFEALIDTPIDPGNDEGPFWQIASLLDERQVRRALAIVDRMDASKWCYHLAGSRSELAIRLAWLGHWREATAQLAHMRHDDYADSWRARTTGGIIAARLTLDASASATALLAEVIGDSRWHTDVVTGLVGVRPESTAHVEAFVDYALAITDAKSRTYALELLAGSWATVLPAARWLAVGVAPLVLAEAIHDAGGDPTDVLALAPRDAASFPDLCQLRAYLDPVSCLPAFAAWLHTHTRPFGRFELAAVLVWLGGPEALLAVGRAITRAIRPPSP